MVERTHGADDDPIAGDRLAGASVSEGAREQGHDTGGGARERLAGGGGADTLPGTTGEHHAGDRDLTTRAEAINARLGRGEIDEATHDAQLRGLVEDADPTLDAMEVAGRIRNDGLRERTEGGVLGRYVNDTGMYSYDELTALANALPTEAGVTGFLAALSGQNQAEVRRRLAKGPGQRDPVGPNDTGRSVRLVVHIPDASI